MTKKIKTCRVCGRFQKTIWVSTTEPPRQRLSAMFALYRIWLANAAWLPDSVHLCNCALRCSGRGIGRSGGQKRISAV